MKRVRSGEYWGALLDLLACVAGFASVILCENFWNYGDLTTLDPATWIITCSVSAVITWFFVVLSEGQEAAGVRLGVNDFLAVIGGNLLGQCGLNYVFGIPLTSWFVMIVGSAASVTIARLLQMLLASPAADRERVIMLGSGDFANLPAGLQNGFLEQLDSSTTLPLPEPEDLAGIHRSTPPATIILHGKPTEISARQLLRMHYSGIEIDGASFRYEETFHRVAWHCLQPADLLFSLDPGASRLMLAFQAVYKNVIGLLLRLIFAPLLILASLLIVFFTGGPALEHIECLGFRGIPFRMSRFRVLHSDGTLSGIGKLIDRLHLTNLPQLMNVVRGEMTLCGPAPVRAVFAERLEELMPAYAFRSMVRPGMFGWPDVNLPVNSGLEDEMLRLEYDLYYVKQESPSLDLDILLRIFSRLFSAKPRGSNGSQKRVAKSAS